MQEFKHQNNLIGVFAQHKVAANLLMIIMIMVGVWALTKLNTQFLPNFALDIISVRVVWTGASAEDVENSITRPVEQELRTLDGVKEMNSTSARGISSVTIEYNEGTDMGVALDQVKEKISLLRNLPQDSEEPEVSRIIRYEPIARVLITGTEDPSELRQLARKFERELLADGIAKVEISGLPEEEIAIQVPSAKLEELGLTLEQISAQVRNFSQDIPAGSVGQNDVARQLRSIEQRRDEFGFAELPVIADRNGRLVKLEDIATIERRPQDGEVLISYLGKPAIELALQRTETADALDSAKILQQWLEKTEPLLPSNIKLHVYDQAWELIDERINLLLKNGLGGLVLVVAVLFIFLNGRVAFWVAAGIPISLMGMLAVLYVAGGSINMVSLFAMIMALGVIVDDAIVVGEDGFAHFQTGENPLSAAEGGAQRMLAPVTAASLTTISAFLPLMMIGDVMGNILFDIPLVMICVLLASLFECFLVLPGHLRHSFHKLHKEKNSPFRQKLEDGFNHVRDDYFRPLVTKAIALRWVVVASILASFFVAIGLLAGGRVNFTFFPSPDGKIIISNATFVAGSSPERVKEFLIHVEEKLYETEKEVQQDVIKMAYVKLGIATNISQEGGGGGQTGDQFGSLLVELTSPDSRPLRNREFINLWEQKVQKVPGLESFTIVEQKGGPPGTDIQVRFYGDNLQKAKEAVVEFANKLKTYPGVGAVEDDLPYGQEEMIFSLTPQAEAYGLTVASVSQQLRSGFDGYLTQIFQDGDDEVEVRVVLPDDERYNLAKLQDFSIQLPTGDSMPFSSAVDVRTQRGFEALRHAEGLLAVQVSAEVDKAQNNANKILADLEAAFLPELTARYGLDYSLEGRAADQANTFADMLSGLILGVMLMYLILSWQFASYGWPLVVMSVIPFGLVGAIFGHLWMGMDLTILSLFGFFGLSGIVVNDSIVLVTFYRHLREAGMPVRLALIEAACQRLRAVLLTSLTTIFGLTPLLFETSLQAQFLIPMATSISFGLMFSTILVLIALPSLLHLYEEMFAPEEAWKE
ncbi:efflux RND transporter permease subunit [Candidatus Albibeggiatoa sp. nov. NOAA]|uniref:efflux RND transporter permease subunit n=1 Tax=Candidatus Albibeggiatoa sp. nov. NOAA TaxID=3162724 RepID=UPI003304B5C3|nr:efflux RND transporter permease subunit [Thiotrichaceae bacterium]